MEVMEQKQNVDNFEGLDLESEFVLKFRTLRDISTKEDAEKNRRIFSGQAYTKDLIGIEEWGNVRGYLTTNKAGDKKINKRSVHAKILETLQRKPEDFNILNNGITIKCSGLDKPDSDRSLVKLKGATIVNGSQTLGVCEVFHNTEPDKKVPIFFKLIYAKPTDENRHVDKMIAITSNQQNAVKNISIAGKLGAFDELNSRLDVDIQRSESDKEGFDIHKILRLVLLVMPNNIWDGYFTETLAGHKIYGSKNKWLNRWIEVYDEKDTNENAAAIYKFTLDIAQEVLDMYYTLKRGAYLKGTGRQITTGFRKDEDGGYIVSDAWVFPLMYAMSSYVTERNGKWVLNCPKDIDRKYKGLLAVILKASNYMDNKVAHESVGKERRSYVFTREAIDQRKNLAEDSKEIFKNV